MHPVEQCAARSLNYPCGFDKQIMHSPISPSRVFMIDAISCSLAVILVRIQ